MRHRLAIAVALTVLGILLAHALDGVWSFSEAHGHMEAGTHEHVSGLSLPTIIVALLVACIAIGLSRFAMGPRAGFFVVLPFVAWIAQEASERVGHIESSTFDSQSLTHMILGLLLQVPIALLIYLLVRVAVAAVRRLREQRPRQDTSSKDADGCMRPRPGFAPRISILARGSPTRGPPLLVPV